MLAAIVSIAPAAALPAATAAGSGLSTDNGTCAALMSANGACRLCGGAITPAFSTRVLGRYTVRYGLCGQCRSLQSESPYWLAEAYSRNLSSLDTGAAQRNLRNLAASYAVARIYAAHNLLDLGGGDGLLCRLLRDTGLNCHVRDRYAQPTYAQGFDRPDFEVPDMVTAFEIFEHLPEPAVDLAEFFAGQSARRASQHRAPSVDRVQTGGTSAESGRRLFLQPPGAGPCRSRLPATVSFSAASSCFLFAPMSTPAGAACRPRCCSSAKPAAGGPPD
ncbi:MAG: hypothetical protein IPK42_25465 [Betaproteobacteria bacterium]|nr:hypothetical protein [Betaproteobacteria bacterium]